MRVLVAVASKHGSTTDIAAAIATELTTMGIDAEARDVAQVPSIDTYDAVILGSAIYMGDWLASAREFADRYEAQLASKPVWLFSSGPLGHDDPQPTGDPARIGELVEQTGARGHQIFVGKLDKHNLGVGERLITRVVNAPEGDFRNWDAIRQWAREIGNTLPAPAEPDQTSFEQEQRE